MSSRVTIQNGSILGQQDLYLFNEGSHLRLYDKLGAHLAVKDGTAGTNFAVWAPSADYVSVFGDFNGWNKGDHRLHPRESSGIWELFVPGVGQGTKYKFHVGNGQAGPVTMHLREQLVGLQTGQLPDKHGWMVPVL